MSNPEYESCIDDLVRSWKDDVLPAAKIYALASLGGMTDTYDVSSIFPMFSDQSCHRRVERLVIAPVAVQEALSGGGVSACLSGAP